jgi:ParB family chromosome partitioning protein
MSKPSTLGLDGLGDLSALLEMPASGNRPLELGLDEIIEDPHQPRVEFDEETLAELAESIKDRGVKTPISVRTQDGGGYIINHGARRYRASKLAGKKAIPAYVDDDYTDEDQIIENIHRDALKPREIAEYIGRKLSQGKQQKDIAKALKKSKAWVSQHATLLDLPEAIAEIFNSGRTTDVTAINELVNCHKEDPEATLSWMETQEISRGTVKRLRDYIATREKSKHNTPPADKADKHHRNPDQASPASTLRKPVIGVSCDQKKGTLLYAKRPTKAGCAWVCIEGKEKEAKIEKIRLLSVSES